MTEDRTLTGTASKRFARMEAAQIKRQRNARLKGRTEYEALEERSKAHGLTYVAFGAIPAQQVSG